jgi:hypothetical protein
MSKPVMPVTITNSRRKSVTIPAVFDSGSFYTLIRRDCLPAGTSLEPLAAPRMLRAASRGSRLRVTGTAVLVITVGGKKVLDYALVSPDLAREMIIGAGTMQQWDITIRNQNGRTRIVVARDMEDPEITEVD